MWNLRDEILTTVYQICRKPPGQRIIYGTPNVKQAVAFMLMNREWIPKLIQDMTWKDTWR